MRSNRHTVVPRVGILLTACALAAPAVGALGASSPAAAAPADDIRISEVVSDGGTPDDWVELTNQGAAPVDLSGWDLLDEDDTKEPSVFDPGTVLEPGAFLVVERDELGFGLGKGDKVRLFSPEKVEVDRAEWPAKTHAAPSLQRCDGQWGLSEVPSKGAANICGAPVAVNEIASDGDDFVELKNLGANEVDLSGFAVRDSEDDHTYTIPEGTRLAAGGFLVITGDELGFGLGKDDAARLLDPSGTLVSSLTWTAHVKPSFGICDGEAAPQREATPGAENVCGEAVEPAQPLPGTGEITVADAKGTWGEDLSGLDIQVLDGGAEIMWATNNDKGQITRLERTGDTWTPSAGWGDGGVATRFADGTGAPDGEGISVGLDGKLYQSVERDNDQGGTSRNTVLRYAVPEQVGSELVAEAEWNLTELLPATGANAGLEAIEVVPAEAFANLGGEVPADAEAYAFVALEATGQVYAVALQPGGKAQLVATLDTPLAGVMALDYTPQTNLLWAFCDEACDGESVQFDLNAKSVAAGPRLARIDGLENHADEGVALSPSTACEAGAGTGTREIWFADDSAADGHSIRGTELTGVDCLPAAVEPTPGEGGEPVEGGEPGEGGEPADDGKPVEDGKPVDDGKPVEDGKPVDGGKRAEQPGDEKSGADDKGGQNSDPACAAPEGEETVRFPVSADPDEKDEVAVALEAGDCEDTAVEVVAGQMGGSVGSQNPARTGGQSLARTGIEAGALAAAAAGLIAAGAWTARRRTRA